MQHLTSSQQKEDVAVEEIPKEASPCRSREGDDVEALKFEGGWDNGI